MKEPLRRHYLAAMGIQLWCEREVDVGSERPGVVETVTVQKADPTEGQVISNPAVSEDQINGPPEWITEAPPIMDEFTPPVDLNDVRINESQTPDQGKEIAGLDWDGLEKKAISCTSCELHRTRTNVVFGVGDKNADLMVIGEAPGADEDRQGEPFVGRAGQLLNAMLLAIGLKREQVFIANILKCRPPGNRDPHPEEALRCAPYLKRQIVLVRPRVIMAVGRVAAQNLLKTEEAVGRLRGREFSIDSIPTIVTYHPAYLLRKPQEKVRAWQDLQRAANMLLTAS